MNLEQRNLEMEFKVSERLVRGYGILFNHESRDLGGFTEIIKPEAISKELLDGSDIKVYLDHNKDKGILARSKNGGGSLSYEIDERGVIYSFEAPNTALGNEVVEGLTRGDYNESSFAFVVEKDNWTKRSDGTYLRTISKIKKVYDFSIVADGAYSDTYVAIAKRSLETFKEDELRAIEAAQKQAQELEEQRQLEELNKQTNKQTKKKTMEKFSLIKTINAVANRRGLDEAAQNVIEAGKAEMRKAGLTYSGDIVIPVEERAAIVAGSATNGQENVAEDKLNILEPLRANLVFTQAGATFMSGLVGDVSIPVYSGSNVGWADETGDAADGAGKFTEVNLSPKRLTAFIDVSKQFLLQDSNSAEEMLKRDIVEALKNKLEATILGNGAGSTSQPAGLMNGVVADSSVATYKDIVALETTLEDKNVNGTKYFIMSPKAKGDLKTIEKATGTAQFVMNGNDVMGYPVLTTSNVAAKGIVFGNFADYIIAQWGGIELTVDPYTQAGAGKVRIVVNAYFDAKPKRAESFVKKILKA